MAHFLDPKYDLTFKRVFGEHKHLCMSLQNKSRIWSLYSLSCQNLSPKTVQK